MSAGPEDALRLLRRAQSDLKALRHMADPDCFDDNIFGFHAQQAVEKALKAWLAGLGGIYPLRHDLGELLAALAAAGQDVGTLWGLTDLTPFAVQWRYDEVDAGSPLDREAVGREVAGLIARVEALLALR